MDAEERWAQRKQWDEERRLGFDWELDHVYTVEGGECAEPGCIARGTMTRYEIAPVPNEAKISVQIDLCSVHSDDDTAWDIFDDRVSGRAPKP